MQRLHARLVQNTGDDSNGEEKDADEERYVGSRVNDVAEEKARLLRGSESREDEASDGGGEEDDERDDGSEHEERDSGNHASARQYSQEHSINMEAERDASEGSGFWDAEDMFVPLPRLPQTTQEDHSIIDVLAEELLQREIPKYLEEFEIVIPDAEIVVGSVPVEEIQQREQDVEEAKLRHAELESELYRRREVQLAKQEEFARARLLHEARTRQEALAKERMQFVEAMQLRTRRLGYVFQQAENHLKSELERQQARVQRVYGDLAHSRVPQSRKRYRVEWQKIPVTIKIRVKMLNALKDKLPSGHYVMVVTLYDRLGGHALHWSAWDPEYDPSTVGKHKNSNRRKGGQQHSSQKNKKSRKSDDSDPETDSPSIPPSAGHQIRLGKPNFTRPFHHRGRFYNTEVAINQNVYVVCPPECTLRPGNVLIFELFHLSSSAHHHHHHQRRHRHAQGQQHQQQDDDQVIAWGAMPLTTPDFQCIQGKYKIPMLKGEMDPTMDKFRDIEQMYQSDLSSWLCNLYFKVSHLEKRLPQSGNNGGGGGNARYPHAGGTLGDDDFDVEIDESSGLYRLENNHQRYMRKLTKSHIKHGRSGRNLLLQEEDEGEGEFKSDFDGESRNNQIRTRHTTTKDKGKKKVMKSDDGTVIPEDETLEDIVEDKLSKNGKYGQGGDGGGIASAVSSYPSSRTLLLEGPSENGEDWHQSIKRKKISQPGSSSRSSSSRLPFTPVLTSLRRTWKRFLAPKKTRVYSGEMVEKKRHEQQQSRANVVNNGSESPTPHQQSAISGYRDEEEDNEASSSEDSNAEEDPENPKGSSLDVDNYKFSVNEATSVETSHQKRFHMQRKLYYLRHELFVDLGLSNFHTLEFWRLVTLLLFTLWVRVYVHYVMQWIFLRGNRIPVYDFRPQWTTCLVKYTWKTMATSTEIGVIVFGVLGNVLLFGFLALSAAVGQRFVGELPHFASSFIVCVGLATVMDPYLVLTVDVVMHHYSCSSVAVGCAESLASSKCRCVDGDAFKLYVRFLAQEGSGLVGAIMTVIIYAALTCFSLVCVYAYLLHIHMNGRMLDVYRRIHGQEEDFFVPHDGEIGLPDLRAICEQAKRWKGPRGSQRKVFVHEYALTDPLDPAFEEKNVHVAVYTMELDGARELHRHFLKSNDGAVIELFGEIGPSSEGAWLRGAHSATSLALLYNIIQDQQAQTAETSSEQLTKLFDEL